MARQTLTIDEANEQIRRLLSSIDDLAAVIKNYHESNYSYNLRDETIYKDTDHIHKEIAEIYSYNENTEHVINYTAFENFLDNYKYQSTNWNLLNDHEKIDIILKLNEQLEIKDNFRRLKIYRCILYMVQGCWNYTQSIDEINNVQKANAILFYRYGTFEILIKLLYLEKNLKRAEMKVENIKTTTRLRVIFSILCTIIEIVRNDDELVDRLKDDLLNPENNELLIVTLFNMIVEFVNNKKKYSYYPIKKILILLWKLILIILGGLDKAKQFKYEQRLKYNLIDDHDKYVDNNRQQKGRLRPKLNQQNYVEILNRIRLKYIGFIVENDSTTLAGLPDCIIESIETLQKHLYIPLSEKHEEQERLYDKHYNKYEDYDLNPIELLYQALLPKLALYIGALKRIFLTLLTNNQNNTNLRPLIIEILPVDMASNATELMIQTIDIRRHKEIVYKAISGILLLFLKHFKNNHYYQYEYLCTILIREGFLTAIVKFPRENLINYTDTPNEINVLEFPLYIVKRFEYAAVVSIEDHYEWRHLYTCINFSRILNKIVKRKPQRIELLIRYNIYSCLKQNVDISNRLLQYYSMKLMKLQLPYLKKTWIKANLNIINAIYHQVRYHLLDDFLQRPTNTMVRSEEDCIEEHLQIRIDNFHKRRYNFNNTKTVNKNTNNNNNNDMDNYDDYQPVDNCFQSILGQQMELCPIFKQNYETWLEYKVFKQDPDRFVD